MIELNCYQMKDVGFGTWEAGESVTLRLESRNNQGKLFERIPKIVSIQLNALSRSHRKN